jgi:hypothetical protein
MEKPTMTLQDIQRALDTQDGQLEAACRALTELRQDEPIAVSGSAFESLRETCGIRDRPNTASGPTSGIRC